MDLSNWWASVRLWMMECPSEWRTLVYGERPNVLTYRVYCPMCQGYVFAIKMMIEKDKPKISHVVEITCSNCQASIRLFDAQALGLAPISEGEQISQNYICACQNQGFYIVVGLEQAYGIELYDADWHQANVLPPEHEFDVSWMWIVLICNRCHKPETIVDWELE
jgi:hypothetical protein